MIIETNVHLHIIDANDYLWLRGYCQQTKTKWVIKPNQVLTNINKKADH